MKETFNRWQVLAASTAILLCTGVSLFFFRFRWASKFFNRLVNVRNHARICN